MVINSILNCIKSWINCNNAVLNCSKSRLNCNKSAQIFSDIYFKCQCATPIGSGPRYQILSHVFARCASQKTYGHARNVQKHVTQIIYLGPLPRHQCHSNATAQLCNDQVVSCWVAALRDDPSSQPGPAIFGTTSVAPATMGKTVRVGVDPGFPHCHPLTPSLGISSLTRLQVQGVNDWFITQWMMVFRGWLPQRGLCPISIWADSLVTEVVNVDLLLCTGFDSAHENLFLFTQMPWHQNLSQSICSLCSITHFLCFYQRCTFKWKKTFVISSQVLKFIQQLQFWLSN